MFNFFKKSKKHKSLLDSKNKISILSKQTPFAYKESYKALRTNLNFLSFGGEIKKILVTSALANEGKSSVSINLALSLSEIGKNVVIIDADLRNPSVHQYLHVRRNSTPGLTSYLSGIASLSDVVGSIPNYNIDVIPVGEIPPNPAELIAHSRFNELLIQLEDMYDYVIVDSPPTNIVADSVIASQFVDGVILVVRQNFANSEEIILAKNRLATVNANILGVILNSYDVSKSNGKSGYDYTYEYFDQGEK